MQVATTFKQNHKQTLTAIKQTYEMRLIFKLTLFTKTILILNPFSNKLKLRRLLLVLALENNDVTPNKNYRAQTNITLSLTQPLMVFLINFKSHR